MNHRTLHAYEEDGELFVYRCPDCGSTGEAASRCEAHAAPMGDYLRKGPRRERVRVPGVGEPPEGESIDAYALQAYGEDHEAFEGAPLKDWAELLLHLEADGWRILRFTQQPAGVGAAAPGSSPAEVPGSADSDGNQQPRCVVKSADGHRCVLSDGHEGQHEAQGELWRFTFSQQPQGGGG